MSCGEVSRNCVGVLRVTRNPQATQPLWQNCKHMSLSACSHHDRDFRRHFCNPLLLSEFLSYEFWLVATLAFHSLRHFINLFRVLVHFFFISLLFAVWIVHTACFPFFALLVPTIFQGFYVLLLHFLLTLCIVVIAVVVVDLFDAWNGWHLLSIWAK